MKKSRKFLSVFLILCLMAGLVPAAFAADAPESEDPILVENDEAEFSNITVTDVGAAALIVAVSSG